MSVTQYRIKQDGLVVASAEAKAGDWYSALKEICIYAAKYVEDGKVLLEVKVGNRWKRMGYIEAETKNDNVFSVPFRH